MRKEEIKEYKKTKRGNKVYSTLNRLLIEGILCILCAIFLIVSTIVMHDSFLFYIFAVILLIAGSFFIMMSFKFKENEILRMRKAKKAKSDKVDKK